ncbi:MAG: MFS transporter, partial [Acidimicrobiales bacterium]
MTTKTWAPGELAALLLLTSVELVVFLDVSIVNVALPSIAKDLKVSSSNLQWVVTAYQLALGGFLLLGGRLADLFGRRRMLMLGLSIFTISSLLCGLSQNIAWLIVTRACQGIGSAITAPAALSILTTVFSEGKERNTALGVWGALAGSGAAIGVLLGGIITSEISWRWIFFLNVPIGAATLLLIPHILPEGARPGATKHLDLVGAFSVTIGLILIVYGVNHSINSGWSDATTLLSVILGFLLLVTFVLVESRTAEPLLQLAIFRLRQVTVANILALLVFGSIFGLFFMLSLYMQDVLGYSALKAGLAYFPLSFTVGVAAAGASQLVNKTGPKPVIAVGMTLVGAALLILSGVHVHAHYASDLLLPFLLAAVGLGLSVVPVQVAAFSKVPEDEAGLASGLINTTQEVGGALMVAAVATISVSGLKSYFSAHASSAHTPAQVKALTAVAQTQGFHTGFLVASILAFIGVGLTLVALPNHKPDPGAPAAA